MEIATLVSILDHPHQAADQLHAWGLRDVLGARQTLLDLADSGLTLDLLAGLCGQLREHLPGIKDPDAAFAALARFLFASRSPLALGALFDRDPQALPMLLSALSLGPQWNEELASDPETFDFLRQSGGQPVGREALIGEVRAETLIFEDERQIAGALSRLKQRHQLRIAYGEITGSLRLELVMEQLTLLAECLVEAALAAAQRLVIEQRPLPNRLDPARLSVAVLALGRLGGGEMDYTSPLELLVIYDAAVDDANQLRAAREHFEHVARLLVHLFSGNREHEPAYQVSLVSLPDAQTPALAHAVEDAALGFESFGRTWHREAMLRARPVAGNLVLAGALLERLQSWIFRRYLVPADDTGMQAWKRRILLDATLHQDEFDSVAIARGGLRDLEATVQFFQLLIGGDKPEARVRGILPAIAGLEQAGALTVEERMLFEGSYVAFRRTEHRQQIGQECAVDRERLAQTWQVLERLLRAVFVEEPAWQREVELLLDPNPDEGEVRAALAPFGFADARSALAALQQLAQEQVPFLSTRRCRHVLAQILPRLLCAVAATPNPDRTLDSLSSVSNSLGGKGVLWELFRSHQPLLELYVRLCAASPYLSSILSTNPGMIDELVDSLQLHALPTLAELQATLSELCRGTADTVPILHDFKNAQHLRIGVRELMGREDIDRTYEALADVAEVCLGHVVEAEQNRLVEKFGMPTLGPGPLEGEPCGLVVVGLGKLGGREPNYHSALEVLFLYEAEGLTRSPSRSRTNNQTTNNHFFTQLAQRVLKQISELTPKGRLYAIDAQLRPIGVGGALALSFADFAQHFRATAAPIWQWLALCKARPVFGAASTRSQIANLLHDLLAQRLGKPADRDEIYRTRKLLERDASPLNLKRGPGGTTDLEYLVQTLQLEHAGRCPHVLTPGTQDAICHLEDAGILSGDLARRVADSYRFLRRVESGLCLLKTNARHDLPADPESLHQLALLIGHSNPAKLREGCMTLMAQNRELFKQMVVPQDEHTQW